MPFPVLHPKVDCAGPTFDFDFTTRLNPMVGFNGINTGPLSAGDYEFRAYVMRKLVGLSACCSVVHMDAADIVILNRWPIWCLNSVWSNGAKRITLATNERLRMYNEAISAGSFEFALFWRKVG